jgi:hypothetical protein
LRAIMPRLERTSERHTASTRATDWPQRRRWHLVEERTISVNEKHVLQARGGDKHGKLGGASSTDRLQQAESLQADMQQ